MQHPDSKRSSNDPACCLHLVAGAGRDVLDACFAQVSPGDTIVFLDAGVLQLLQSFPGLSSAAGATFFAEADLQAHGLLEAARDLQAGIINDADICTLLAQCKHCLTWR